MKISALERPSDIGYWTPEPLWRGQTVFVIGGGPSLLHYAVSPLRGRNVIAVNNAYLIAPWAQYLFFHDSRWLDWHIEDVQSNFNGKIVTPCTRDIIATVHKVRRDRKVAINCTDHGVLGGIDSGTMAVNLAFHLGASTIVLVGFDMGFMDAARAGLSEDERVRLQTPRFHPDYQMPKSRAIDTSVLKHWHQEHPIPPLARNYDNFLRQYPNIVRALTAHNCRLVSLTPTRIDISTVRLHEIPKT